VLALIRRGPSILAFMKCIPVRRYDDPVIHEGRPSSAFVRSGEALQSEELVVIVHPPPDGVYMRQAAHDKTLVDAQPPRRPGVLLEGLFLPPPPPPLFSLFSSPTSGTQTKASSLP